MKVILVLIPMIARPMISGSNVIKVTAKIFFAVASRPILKIFKDVIAFDSVLGNPEHNEH